EWIELSGFDLSHAPASVGDAWRTGEWSVQVVARVNSDSPRPGEGAGDLYSDAFLGDMGEAGEDGVIGAFILANVVEDEPFEETDRTKLFTVRSELLS